MTSYKSHILEEHVRLLANYLIRSCLSICKSRMRAFVLTYKNVVQKFCGVGSILFILFFDRPNFSMYYLLGYLSHLLFCTIPCYSRASNKRLCMFILFQNFFQPYFLVGSTVYHLNFTMHIYSGL